MFIDVRGNLRIFHYHLRRQRQRCIRDIDTGRRHDPTDRKHHRYRSVFMEHHRGQRSLSAVRLRLGRRIVPPAACGTADSSRKRLLQHQLRPVQKRQGHLRENLEKAPGAASHTGIHTRSGSQLSLNFKNLGAARQVQVVMHYEVVCNVSAAGCEILD